MKPTVVVLCPLNPHRACSGHSFWFPRLTCRPHLLGLASACLWALWLLGLGPAASAVTFTTNTLISFNDSTYDGQDIVVSNCTVTVDGTHSFLNVHVLSGGILTHSFSPSAVVWTNSMTTQEIHYMSTTNVQLYQANVAAGTVVVTDEASQSQTYVLGLDYSLTATNSYTWLNLLPGSSITNNETILVSYTAVNSPVNAGLYLTVTNNVEVEAGGAIDATGIGYGASLGPGAGASQMTNYPYSYYSGSGAGHGGFGGNSSSQAPGGTGYGLTDQPREAGSGGGAGSGSGGAGGGVVNLSAGGVVRVDGRLSADGLAGVNPHSGGGAGGSIWLKAQIISGAGVISAMGGAGEPNDGGGGGGGKIAIQWLWSGSNAFTGTLAAQGGAGAMAGGAGAISTLPFATNTISGQCVVDNGGLSGAKTWLVLYGLYDLTISGGAVAEPPSGAWLYRLFVRSNGWFTWSSTGSVPVTVQSDAIVDAGGGIISDGRGFAPGLGTGAGRTVFSKNVYTGGGAGYGGPGGPSAYGAGGGISYGAIHQPNSLGSGGGSGNPQGAPGGAGGGSLQLAVNGTLTVNGRISADGWPGKSPDSGGGSGGSVWLTVGMIAGTGAISANGGSGELPLGGGAGGGRVAIYYDTNLFNGSVAAHGGLGAMNGSAGTIYWQGPANAAAQVIVDNGGAPGATNTLVRGPRPGCNLTVGGLAAVAQVTGTVLGNLFIGSNCWFTAAPNSDFPFVLSVTNNATIQRGGGLSFDGLGSAGGTGTGPGRTTGALGGGGGYGGYGGASLTNGALGGITYGLASAPVTTGSGGGAGSGTSPYNVGGSGGGAFELLVTNALLLDGTISANGKAGIGQNSGGGSGGSVFLSVGSISGSGLVSANGGAGDLPYGGGGGGGRIGVYYSTSQFTGSFAASGGGGANYGGAGTIYLLSKVAGGPGTPSLTIDNGGKSGTNTPVPALSGTYDLTVTGGAQAVLGSPIATVPLRTLLIASNSWLICTNLETVLSVSSTGTVQTGGGILLDGYGYAGGQGTGAGRNSYSPQGIYVGSGAGYGGPGGPSLLGLGGGISYGSITSPNIAGSGGGNSTGTYPYYLGGSGGGALQMTVSGTLALDGRISANGGNAVGAAAGGGSGGSILLTVAKFTGKGAVSANGGAGGPPYGGGGGGGRIAVIFNSQQSVNQFTGTYSAHGGAGAFAGAAGTVYIRSTLLPLSGVGQLVTDNGGLSALSNTVVNIDPESLDVTVSGGAKAALSNAAHLRSLLVASNSWLTFLGQGLPYLFPAVTVSADATVQAGGGISLDGVGSPAGSGTGAGHSLSSPPGLTAGGGGYGGVGGSSLFGAAGGSTYGSLTAPTTAGSGGGTTTGSVGGGGGGLLTLTVNGTFALNGRLSADGLAAGGPGNGGGSGGGLNLTAGILTGAGVISASGGAGDPPYGGGGGGGRIAVNVSTNRFTGGIFAVGGPGAMAGGAGTIYLGPWRGGKTAIQLFVDNGGQLGTNTPVAFPNGADVSISGGAAVAPTSTGSLNSLTINSNSWVAYTNIQLASLSISGSLTIGNGGGISLKGGGYGPGAGPGAGGYGYNPAYLSTACGGGYGGVGASSLGGGAGGSSYGSLLQPTDPGSGAGNLLYVASGSGGGALQLTVGNTLQVDGVVTADGGDAPLDRGGGGSGGSLWLTVGKMAGAGVISASGGNGDSMLGGGGGGGRIAIYYGTNQFQGGVRAWGGMGAFVGGAGTIYSKANASGVGQVAVDNGGWAGTNTPLTTPEAFGLTVSGAAIVNPASAPLVLGNLLVDSGGMLTHLGTQSNLDVTVLTNAVVGRNGAIVVDGEGYNGSNGGPGAGIMTNAYSGSGAGYGGAGGAGISGIAGGGIYGSSMQPSDRGSRGGVFPMLAGFSQGAGAIRLKVGGALTVNGIVSANGNATLIEGGGGGAGGSVWLTARSFGGNGMIFANGGPGEPTEGGGGGGGRIAVYCLSNGFSGTIGAYGGAGASPGAAGTVYLANNIPFPQVVAQSPSGVVESAVSYVDLTFGSPMNFSSAAPADFSLDTPNGTLPPGSLAVAPSDLSTVRISFPTQSTLGYYQIEAGPQVADIYGQNMAAAYLGIFAITPPTISGRVVDTNGLGVPYLTIQVSGDAFPVLTDANGDYSLEVFPSWAGTITPERGGRIFIPPSRTYTNVSNDLTNQNFVMATSAVLALTSQRQGTNLNLSWYGLNGVSYQVLCSTNMVNWVPYSLVITGANAPLSLAVPIDVNSLPDFFRFSAGY
jgi:hypothetical protein